MEAFSHPDDPRRQAQSVFNASSLVRPNVISSKEGISLCAHQFQFMSLISAVFVCLGLISSCVPMRPPRI